MSNSRLRMHNDTYSSSAVMAAVSVLSTVSRWSMLNMRKCALPSAPNSSMLTGCNKYLRLNTSLMPSYALLVKCVVLRY